MNNNLLSVHQQQNVQMRIILTQYYYTFHVMGAYNVRELITKKHTW